MSQKQSQHKLLSVRQMRLPIENLQAVVREFQQILTEQEIGKKIWRIIIKQELT